MSSQGQHHLKKYSTHPSLHNTGKNRVADTIKYREEKSLHFYKVAWYTMVYMLIALILFFIFIAPVQHTLSLTGIAIMVISALARIKMTIQTTRKARNIQFLDAIMDTTHITIIFYQYRTYINETLSPIIYTVFTLGFCLILPEFMTYLETWVIISIIGVYAAISIIFIVIVQRNMRREVQSISRVIHLKEDLHRYTLNLKNKAV